MASMDDADLVWTLEVYQFPEHVEKPIGVYSGDGDGNKQLVAEGDTVEGALGSIGSSNDTLEESDG